VLRPRFVVGPGAAIVNVARLVIDNIDRFGEYPLIHFGGGRLSNVEVERYSARIAAVLREHGVAPGDRVLIAIPNSPDVIASFLAIWRLGAVPLPATPQLGAPELAYLLGNSEAKVALTSRELAPRLLEASRALPFAVTILAFRGASSSAASGVEAAPEPALASVEDLTALAASAEPVDGLVDCAPDQLALLLYTSGTTGQPKGVMISQRAVVGLGQPKVTALPPLLTTLHVLPLSHGFGVNMMVFTLMKGMQSAILPRWNTRRVFELIQELRVSRFAVVPTMLTDMLEFPDRERFDVSSLKVAWSGGAGLPLELRRQFERTFDCRITDGYALTECNGSAVVYWDGDAFRPGSVGRAMPDVDLRIVDDQGRDLPPGADGEVLIRSDTLMLGYWRNEEATRATLRDGWLHSGDVGHLDADGYLYLVGRKKELIIKGGENIAPREIEEALYGHPDVAEAAVVGMPDRRLGEDIWAAVQLRAGALASENDLRSHLAARLIKFKVPTRVVILETMPKNATGKIQKRAVKEMLARQETPASREGA
jgi:long-chain acyl-CoA synthetase